MTYWPAIIYLTNYSQSVDFSITSSLHLYYEMYEYNLPFFTGDSKDQSLNSQQMNQSKNDFKIDQSDSNGKPCLKFIFTNLLTQKHALELCSEWKTIALSDTVKTYTIIFNAKEMVDYEPMARITFQKTISKLKNQIEKIWLVTDSKMISGGAAIMSLLSSFPIKAVDSEAKVVV